MIYDGDGGTDGIADDCCGDGDVGAPDRGRDVDGGVGVRGRVQAFLATLFLKDGTIQCSLEYQMSFDQILDLTAAASLFYFINTFHFVFVCVFLHVNHGIVHRLPLSFPPL